MATVLVPASAKPMAPVKPALPVFVTLLAGRDDELKGVIGLAKGLRKAKSAYLLVVAVLPDVPEEHRRILEEQGCVVREIEPVFPPENETRIAMAYDVINYSKLRLWEFVGYSKLMYLDSNIQVFNNIDHLFDMDDGHFYAVMDCCCQDTWRHTPQYANGYCQLRLDQAEWRDEAGKPLPACFNTGMFILEPSLATFQSLLSKLETTPRTPLGEQGFLNTFFREQYFPIPLPYNLDVALLWRHPEIVALERLNVVRYCAAGSKPWTYTGKEENMQREDIKMLVEKWWDIYKDESLDYWNWARVAAVGEAEPGKMEPFIACLSEAGAVQPAPSAA